MGSLDNVHDDDYKDKSSFTRRINLTPNLANLDTLLSVQSPTNDIILYNNHLYRKYQNQTGNHYSYEWKRISYTEQHLDEILKKHGTIDGLR